MLRLWIMNLSNAAMENLCGLIKALLKVTGLMVIPVVLAFSDHLMEKNLRGFGNKTGKMVSVFLGKEI